MLEGSRQTVLQPVSAIITGYIGLTAYMDLDAMNRMLGEGDGDLGRLSGARQRARGTSCSPR